MLSMRVRVITPADILWQMTNAGNFRRLDFSLYEHFETERIG